MAPKTKWSKLEPDLVLFSKHEWNNLLLFHISEIENNVHKALAIKDKELFEKKLALKAIAQENFRLMEEISEKDKRLEEQNKILREKDQDIEQLCDEMLVEAGKWRKTVEVENKMHGDLLRQKDSELQLLEN